jgi:hypothetical protein
MINLNELPTQDLNELPSQDLNKSPGPDLNWTWSAAANEELASTEPAGSSIGLLFGEGSSLATLIEARQKQLEIEKSLAELKGKAKAQVEEGPSSAGADEAGPSHGLLFPAGSLARTKIEKRLELKSGPPDLPSCEGQGKKPLVEPSSLDAPLWPGPETPPEKEAELGTNADPDPALPFAEVLLALKYGPVIYQQEKERAWDNDEAVPSVPRRKRARPKKYQQAEERAGDNDQAVPIVTKRKRGN